MKSRYIVLFGSFLLTLTALVASAQEYDFALGKFTDVGSVKFGGMVRFKVTNINTFRYKVKINGVQINYATPIPTELQALFRVSEPSETAKEASEASAKTDEATNEMIKVAEEATAGSRLKTEMDTLVARCVQFAAVANKIRIIKYRRAELIGLTKQKWPDYDALSNQLTGMQILVRANMYQAVQDFFIRYEKAENQYETAIDAARAASNTSAVKRIEAALKRFKEGYNTMEEGNLLQFVEDVDVLQTALAEEENFTFLAPAIQADGDFVAFDITIEPDRTNALLPHEAKTTSRIEIPVRGGWKADFSVGPNLSLGNGARDEKYFLNPTAEGKGKLTQGSNLNAVRPGIAAMIHAYPRLGKNYAIAGLLGVGAGFKADAALTAAYYLGVSVVAGKQQRLMLSAGCSFLPVERLKVNYQVDKEYDIESTKITDLTEKVLRPSVFFGISYNITNRVELK